MATATVDRPRTEGTNGTGPEQVVQEQLTREQAAEQLYEMLTDEPQSIATLRRRLKGDDAVRGQNEVTLSGLGVLEAQHRAMRVLNPATGKDGWVLYNERRKQAVENPTEVEFPYKWAMVKVDQMFIDKDYQRPLTTFADRIANRFDPVLFGVLVLSDRGRPGRGKKRFAIVDGQTRWFAATKRKITEVPAIIFSGLTPADEATMFADLQKERRNAATWYRFRAALVAEKPEALAIRDLVENVGYKLGMGVGEIKAISALEKAYRSDDFALARALSNLKDAWPEVVPEDAFISGLHYFLTHFPIKDRKRKPINDEVLVRKLKSAGPRTLMQRMMAIKDSGEKGNKAKLMGIAIENTYLKR